VRAVGFAPRAEATEPMRRQRRGLRASLVNRRCRGSSSLRDIVDFAPRRKEPKKKEAKKRRVSRQSQIDEGVRLRSASSPPVMEPRQRRSESASLRFFTSGDGAETKK
jgi:hypothetical protein